MDVLGAVSIVGLVGATAASLVGMWRNRRTANAPPPAGVAVTGVATGTQDYHAHATDIDRMGGHIIAGSHSSADSSEPPKP